MSADYDERLRELLAGHPCEVAVPRAFVEVTTGRRGLRTEPEEERSQFLRHALLARSIQERGDGNGDARFEQVVTTDVSRAGLGWLSPVPLHVGDEVHVWLPIGRKRYVVVRCEWHNDRCYEVAGRLETASDTDAARGESDAGATPDRRDGEAGESPAQT